MKGVANIKTYLNNKHINIFLNNKKINIKYTDSSVAPETILEDEIPYISHYYYNPKPYSDEEIIIPVYITDYNESEYVLDDTSNLFKIKVEVNDNISYINDLKAGDHNINLGILTEGEHMFTLQVIDQHNRHSHQLVNEVYVVNRETYPITSAQTYTITDDDLTRYSINKNNSEVEQDMINNRVGLTGLFAEIKANGYRKCVLPQGTYRVNRTTRMGTGTATPISMPSNFTVDMNNSIIKLHPYEDSMYDPNGGVENLMVRFLNCFDSHIINYVFEGDNAEREANGWVNSVNGSANGEHNNCFAFYGGKYNSVKNGIMRNIAGYSHVTGYNPSRPDPIWTGDWVDNIAVNNSGIEISKAGKTTCGFYDITRFIQEKLITFSVWSSVGGIKGKSFFIDIHFYDSNKNYIESIKTMQFRNCKIPANAKFVRATAIGTSEELRAIFIHNQPSPKYCSVEGMEAIDNRTCLAPSTFTNLLYKNINFTRSGKSITPAAIDLEDGWENGQDFFMHDCNVLEKITPVDFIDCAGFNHVIDNCSNFGLEPRHRVYGTVIKNCPNIGIFSPRLGWNNVTRAWRVENNTFIDKYLAVTPMATLENGGYYITLKNNVFNNYETQTNEAVTYVGCDFNKCSVGNVIAKNSTITGYKPYINKHVYENCTFEKPTSESLVTVYLNSLDVQRKTINCIFNTPIQFINNNNFNSGIWDGCTFNYTAKFVPEKTNVMGDIQINNCIFKEMVTIYTMATNYIQFNNCTFEKGKTFLGVASTNCEFNNCIG